MHVLSILKKLEEKVYDMKKNWKGKIDFVECYAIWLKDDACSVTNIGEY